MQWNALDDGLDDFAVNLGFLLASSEGSPGSFGLKAVEKEGRQPLLFFEKDRNPLKKP